MCQHLVLRLVRIVLFIIEICWFAESKANDSTFSKNRVCSSNTDLFIDNNYKKATISSKTPKADLFLKFKFI